MAMRYFSLLITGFLLLLCSCTPVRSPTPQPAATLSSGDPIAALLAEVPPLPKMGFSVQVGAFSSLNNAVRLEQLLEGRGIDAYHFLHESGLYKVRFGNHSQYGAARGAAEACRIRV